ncbi:MAG: hypothetical protein ACE5HO_04645 [bacterium]
MRRWLNTTFAVQEISQLYHEKAGEWLLLEIVETNRNNTPTKLRLLASGPDKDVLHDFIMEDESWHWHKKYLVVLADPDKPCTIA